MLNYRHKPPERSKRLTRAEFIVVISGAAVLALILDGAISFYLSLTPDW